MKPSIIEKLSTPFTTNQTRMSYAVSTSSFTNEGPCEGCGETTNNFTLEENCGYCTNGCRESAPVPEPVRVSLADSILAFLLPAIESHQKRRFMSAPETTLYPDDRFYAWAETVVYGHQETSIHFITKATRADMDELFAALTDGTPEVWPAHRRAFASKFFQLATESDECGMSVSKGFAEFYRERYNPVHQFHCELPVLEVGTAVDHSDPVAHCCGCEENQANQLAHMYPGGCLATNDEEE